MNFALTDEHRMLHDTVGRLASERHGFDVRRAAIADSDGFSRPFWETLGELGILGATLPEACGGLGEGAVAAMLIQSALGRHLVNSPYVPTVTCAANLIARAGTAEQRARLLPPILEGRSIVAFACAEGTDDAGLDGLEATASPVAGGFEIDAHKTLVVGGAWSDRVMVVANIAGGAPAMAAFIQPMTAAGLEVRHARTLDGASASEIRWRKAFVPGCDRIGGGADLRSAIERVRDEAIAALCADAAGSMEALLDATVEYARTRRQFGKAIGTFQALQHRMVDMLVAHEHSASISHRAALALEADPPERQRAVSGAKAFVGKAGRMVAQAAVQIHGGIGTTDELDVSHHFRRIEMFNLQFGTTDQHVRRYAALLDQA